ncbi:ferredoxin [Nocardia gamkensis]|uniref:ferredoxin n=1 Tax=Nocardia gamkensis TaxID=352869 RepID=UPI0036E243E8
MNIAGLPDTALDGRLVTLSDALGPMCRNVEAKECCVMRVSVDREKCSGHARCGAVSEELFPLDEVGYSALHERDVPPSQRALVIEGVDACPEHALILEEDD